MKKILLTTLMTLMTIGNANAQTLLEGHEVIATPRAPVEIPSGDYKLDKSHSSIVFSASHIGFSKYTMQFKDFDAKLKLDVAYPDKSSIEVTIDPKSLDIPAPPAGFKDELLGDKWLDVKKFPQITFKSTKVAYTTRETATVTGDLTLHGVTKPIVLEVTFNGGYKGMKDLDPNARAGFSALGKFNRSDFGVAYGIPAPGTTMGVGDEVNIVIETEFSGPKLK